MLKKEVDRLYNVGVYSEEEYNSIMKFMHVNEKGELIGVIPNGIMSTLYSLKFDLKKQSLVDIVKDSSPWLGADYDFPELFGKYGYTITGICDGWNWFTQDKITDHARNNGYKPIEEATELELWKMLALSNTYLYNEYKEWYYSKK